MSKASHARRVFLSLFCVFCLIAVTAPAARSWSLFGSDTPDDLVGVYSVEDRGQLKEFVRIDKRGDAFFFQGHENTGWSTPAQVTPVSKASFEQLLKQPVTVDFVALGNNNLAIFKVPKGWKIGKFECKTGYWMMMMLGPIELHKQ